MASDSRMMVMIGMGSNHMMPSWKTTRVYWPWCFMFFIELYRFDASSSFLISVYKENGLDNCSSSSPDTRGKQAYKHPSLQKLSMNSSNYLILNIDPSVNCFIQALLFHYRPKWAFRQKPSQPWPPTRGTCCPRGCHQGWPRPHSWLPMSRIAWSRRIAPALAHLRPPPVA